MKALLFLFIAAASALAESPAWEVDFDKWLREDAKKWPPEGVKEVRAYVFPADRTSFIKDGKVRPDVSNAGGALLSEDQAKRLAAALNAYRKPNRVFLCFEPRNAFVLYGDSGTIIATAQICFECRRTAMDFPGFIPGNDFAALPDLFQELKLPVGKFKSAEEFKAGLERD